MHHPPDIVLFFGRFHVLLVHLPIGILFILAILEIAARFSRFKNANASAGLMLTILAPVSVLTAACGWMLSLGGGYAEHLLAWHERFGIATAVGCVLAAILFWWGKLRAYRATLFATVAVMIVAGHLGGSLTHGSDYLVRYAPGPLKNFFGAAPRKKQTGTNVKNDRQQLPVFTDVIEPIFQNKCVRCHGPEKSKDDLRLDSYAQFQEGGDDGAMVNATNPAQSILLHRILLPLDDDHHMPPRGKPQLTPGEMARLKWWVEIGGPETATLTQLRPPPEVLRLISAPPRAH